MFRTIFIPAAMTAALAGATPVLAQQDSQGDYSHQEQQDSREGMRQDAESWDHEPGRESRNPGPDIQGEAEAQLEKSREGMRQDAESWNSEPGRESRNPGPDIQDEAEAQLEDSREGMRQETESWNSEPGRESQNPGPNLREGNGPQAESRDTNE
ncbi:hypothetical protein VRRI112168_13950 [Vreelandella rituensis]|uniref:Uncharacterized protein n=1 Tax=Vreelandella rituensis TaxID=2282306 RepID=A0A368TZQ1_9GAMM|nr:hypothetical protein [Halomonas rituensis]RCV90349.1 hypothetical protein DU506_11610 [Halomonas rituensis]